MSKLWGTLFISSSGFHKKYCASFNPIVREHVVTITVCNKAAMNIDEIRWLWTSASARSQATLGEFVSVCVGRHRAKCALPKFYQFFYFKNELKVTTRVSAISEYGRGTKSVTLDSDVITKLR